MSSDLITMGLMNDAALAAEKKHPMSEEDKSSMFKLLMGLIVIGGIVVVIAVFIGRKAKKEMPPPSNNQKVNTSFEILDDGKNAEAIEKKTMDQWEKIVDSLPVPPNWDDSDPAKKFNLRKERVDVVNWNQSPHDKKLWYAELDEQPDYGFNNPKSIGAFRVLNSSDKPVALFVADPDPGGGLPKWIWGSVMLNVIKKPVYFDKKYGGIRLATISDGMPHITLMMSDHEPRIQSTPLQGNTEERYELLYSRSEFTVSHIIVSILWFICLLWAVYIAKKTSSRENATMNLFMAIIAPPVYLISYYINRTTM